MRIAIVGTGISGLMCAHVLAPHHDIALFEAEGRLGGHTNTVRVIQDGMNFNVDTGFIVYNERNYPGFTRLLHDLGVATQPSDMSFSVNDTTSGVEWAGTSLRGVFAQPKNLIRPRFLRMLFDIVRFSRIAKSYLKLVDDPGMSLGELLAQHHWSPSFRDEYLIPLGAAIWSADPSTFTDFPASTFLRFCENHGLLTYRNRPAWRTVTGGSARYVDAIAATLGDRVHLSTPVDWIERVGSQVFVHTAHGARLEFDHVVIATHSDQALRLVDATVAPVAASAELLDPTTAPSAVAEVLGAIRYQPNHAVLHTDTSVMPSQRSAWASWNYQRRAADQGVAILTYDMTRLQSIASKEPVFVTLNAVGQIDPAKVIAEFHYSHPVFDKAAIRAQREQRDVCDERVSFCGAYWGYGFHEDGLQSALRVCDWLGVKW